MAVCLLGTLAPLQAADKKAETKAPTTADLNVTEFSGKVAETMNVASYTYVLVDTGAQKRWAAAPRFEVKTGDTVKIADAMAMENYQSKTLNRTFDVIYFTGSVTVNGKAPTRASAPPSSSAGGPLPAGHPPVAGGRPSRATRLPARRSSADRRRTRRARNRCLAVRSPGHRQRRANRQRHQGQEG